MPWLALCDWTRQPLGHVTGKAMNTALASSDEGIANSMTSQRGQSVPIVKEVK